MHAPLAPHVLPGRSLRIQILVKPPASLEGGERGNLGALPGAENLAAWTRKGSQVQGWSKAGSTVWGRSPARLSMRGLRSLGPCGGGLDIPFWDPVIGRPIVSVHRRFSATETRPASSSHLARLRNMLTATLHQAHSRRSSPTPQQADCRRSDEKAV
jgi:hypothetical protein